MAWEQIPLLHGEHLQKIDAIYWMVVNSFGIAITTFVGQNYGAGENTENAEKASKYVCLCLMELQFW